MRKDVISANGRQMSSIVWYGWWDLDERIFCASGKTTSLLHLCDGQYVSIQGTIWAKWEDGNWPMPQQTPFFGGFSGGHDCENHASHLPEPPMTLQA